MFAAKPPYLEIDESAPIVPDTSTFRAHFTEGDLVGRPIVVKKVPLADLLKVPDVTLQLLQERPIDPTIRAIARPYFIQHYQEGNFICYVLHDLGQDLLTFLGRDPTPFSLPARILRGLICINLMQELNRYHSHGCTIGDLKLENVVVKVENSATGEQMISTRIIDLEWAGKERRPLTWYTACHLKVFDAADPDFHVATKDQDLHALAITIARIACLRGIDLTLQDIDQAVDNATTTHSRHRSRAYIAEAQGFSRSLLPTKLKPHREPCGVQANIFLECARYLFSGVRTCDLLSCATYLTIEVRKWQASLIVDVPGPLPPADETTRLMADVEGDFNISSAFGTENTTATARTPSCGCCCVQ